QARDGIRDRNVTGVQTCALPIYRLLEFTATIDLENKNVYEKYKDKVLYRYALDRFIQDRYSKNVKRIQSENKDADNMMNVILLRSEERRVGKERKSRYMKKT